MKVYFDNQIFRAQRYGGISHYFGQLIETFVRHPELGIEPIVKIYPSNNYYFRKLTIDLGLDFSSNRYNQSKYINLMDGCLQNKPDPELVHHTFYGYSPFLFQRKIPTISTIHDFIPELFFKLTNRNRFSHRFKKIYIKKSSGLIFVSKSTYSDFLRIHKSKSLISSVIYHGVQKYSCEDNINLHLESPFLLYVGNRDGYKNFSVLRDALVELNKHVNIKLICYGGPPFNSSEVKQFKAQNIFDKVLYFQDTAIDLACLYRDALAFINSSLGEGFGMTNLEAAAHGCHVICSDIPINHEILKDLAQYFNPTSSNSLAQNILSFINSSENFASAHLLSNHARSFSWLSCAENTSNFYHSF